jgi:3-dehydroquinate dehydratase/shikimate dehydrogenase
MNRTTSVGQKLARQARAKFLSRIQMRGLQFDVIVNATPIGMGGAKASPLSDSELNARILFEMVYTPAETKLVKMARAKGMQVITGTEMFVQQGARQFEIWTGKPAPADDMYRVVMAALQNRAANPGHTTTRRANLGPPAALA